MLAYFTKEEDFFDFFFLSLPVGSGPARVVSLPIERPSISWFVAMQFVPPWVVFLTWTSYFSR